MYFDNIAEDRGDGFRLVEFIRRIANFLNELALNPEKILPDLHYRAPVLREAVQFAWQREVGRSMELMIEEATDISPRNAQAAGLTGASLTAKIAIAVWWDSMIPELGKKAISYILKLINSFLGSLAAALSLAEPIKEAKEMLENTLDLD